MNPPNETPTQKQIDYIDMERERLLSSTQKFKSAMEGQVADLKQNTLKWTLKAAVLGGVVLCGYLAIKAIRGKGKTAKNEGSLIKTSFCSAIFASIQNYILSFILAMAREKITSYLEKQLLHQDASSPTNQRKTEVPI